MIWIPRVLTALVFLGTLCMTGVAAFHFKSIGFALTMVCMSAIFGYMTYYDVRRILASRKK